MKVGVVGPVSKDHVVLPTGMEIEKYGAAAYSILALAKLLEGTDDQVMCLTHVSPEDVSYIEELFDHPAIVLPQGQSMVQKGTEIRLTYVDAGERSSKQTRIMSPMTPQEFELVSSCQVVLLMPLNESDIPLSGVQHLRKNNPQSIIFLDAHGLVTGVNGEGERYNKPWENGEEWLKYIDILKMNAKEAQWVAGHPLQQYDEYVEYAAGVVRQGLTTCWITFGDQSSLIAWRRDKRLFWAKVPVVSNLGPVVDTTGCGDSASAGFVYSYAKFHNPLIGVIMGNTFGSLKASFQGVGNFPSQPEVAGIINQHYRDYLHSLLDDFLLKSQLIVHEIKEGNQDESSVFHPDGEWYRLRADHAGCGNSQRTPASWS